MADAPSTQLTDSFYATTPHDPLRLPHPPLGIKAMAPAPAGRVTPPPDEDEYRRPHANARLNGRVWRTVRAAAHVARWQVDIGNGVAPRFLVHDAERTGVQGTGMWALFGPGGAPLAGGLLGGGELVIDPHGEAGGTLYVVNASGALEAHHLADGKRAFVTPLVFGDTYGRRFLAAAGRRVVALGVESAQARLRRPPNTSVLEVIDLGQPRDVTIDGILASAKTAAQLMRPTVKVLAAASGDTIVVAAEDRLYWLDAALHPLAVVAGHFAPLALSLDEAARALMVVDEGAARKLWIVDQNGGRSVDAALGPEAPLAPPLVGPAHEVFVVTASRVRAFGGDGRPRWDQPLGHGAGAVALADGALLVADGPDVFLFDATGKRATLWHAPEPLRAPPVPTATGELLVVGDARLYALAVKP